MKKLMRLFRDDEGATAVEYGIMVAAIAAVIIATVILVGEDTESAFNTVHGSMQALP